MYIEVTIEELIINTRHLQKKAIFYGGGLAYRIFMAFHICLPFTESIIYIPFTTSKWDSDEGRNLCGENRPASK